MGADEGGFDLRQLGPVPSDYDLARALIEEGASFPQIRKRLQEDGLKPEFTERVVVDLAAELIQMLVVGGASELAIQDRLVARGLKVEEVPAVIEKAGRKHRHRLRSVTVKSGPDFKVTSALTSNLMRLLRVIGIIH